MIVVSAHFAAMLAAQRRQQPDGEGEEYDFIFTYDREVIVECAQAPMLRIARLEGTPIPGEDRVEPMTAL